MDRQRAEELRDNYLRILERIEAARIRRGGGDVTLLAASKTMPGCDIEYLIRECGLGICGENHAQEFTEKYDGVRAAGGRMDFIGHLQTNKVKYIAGRAGLIHSVDSLKLAEAIQKECAKNGTTQDILIEVNIGMEESKTGIAPDEMSAMLEGMASFDRINVRGMMTMAPKCQNAEDFRKYFRESYKIYLDFFAKKSHNIGEAVLSMGMSDSFETAIEEGATMVRVGSGIFGSRVYK